MKIKNRNELLKNSIARAIYEAPTVDAPCGDWEDLSPQQQIGWIGDAERVLTVLTEAGILPTEDRE